MPVHSSLQEPLELRKHGKLPLCCHDVLFSFFLSLNDKLTDDAEISVLLCFFSWFYS